ncbi:MAG TPA: diaminopimelate decarboxylase [Gammaproteobacteria bacterium]|jgi:diaminopimelate decarboxylase|nr:diaminopimelate decarboxylase [Gammaproteobacteria bacterium]
MSCLKYQCNDLFIEQVPLKNIATAVGTPFYVYSQQGLETNWRSFHDAFRGIPHHIYYAVKANSNIHILKLFAAQGSGFDIVSLGELERVLAAGGDPQKVIFSGVGKSVAEITQAIEKNIYCFNVESEPEIKRIDAIARALDRTVNIALRVNPNVDAKTHAHISTGLKENKFGIEMEDVVPLCETLSHFPSLHLIGIACHIGSQITELTPFLLAIDSMLALYHTLIKQGIPIDHIDIGGGLGIRYHRENPPPIIEYAHAIQQKLSTFPGKIMIAPGRAIVANAGALVTQVEYLKHHHEKNFAIVDAGMNDLLRPALYEAWQAILPVFLRDQEALLYDVVGPVCESSDFLGKKRKLALQQGDLLAIDAAGAYGFSMSSHYNSRCLVPEVLVNGKDIKIIRRRETIPELFAAEKEVITL